MKPREIDALIAEKVMGWKVKHFSGGSGGFTAWVNDDEHITYLREDYHPSTDISDAWIVIDKLKGLNIVNLNYASGEWIVELYDFDTGKMLAISSSETAPMAICKAALESVGIEIEEDAK